jgi:PAS domain S-box-containing protein
MKSTVKRMDEEEMLEILSEQAPVGVCIMQDGKFCYVNRTFPIAIGYTVDELVGKDSLEIVVPEDREMVRENTMKMLKGELRSPYQFRVTCKDGSIVWVMATVKSIQYHGRRATLGNYMEITERKLMEEAVKESEERYKELASSITDVFFGMDEHLRYTYWNKASEILTGVRMEDAIGKSLREIFPDTPGTRNAEKVYREVLRTRQPQTFVNDFSIDGRHYTFEISAYPARGGISVFVKDITEHKKAEEALQESEERYRALFDRSLDCVYVHDFEGNFLDANETALKLLGYEKKDIPHLNFASLLSQDQLPRVIATLEELRDTGTQKHVNEFRLRCKDGSFVDVEVISAVIYRNGKPYAIQGVGRDVTEHKQAEEALQKSEERYRVFAENAGEAIFVVQDDVVKFINPKGVELSGYSGEELASRPFATFIYPDDIHMVAERYLKRLRGVLVPQTYDFRIIRKDGDIRWGELNAVPISWEDGPAVLCFMSDITDRKQAVEGLRQSEERYRTILEEMEDAYFEVDLGGHLTFVNNSVCRDLGYSREELVGMSYKDFTIEDDIESVFRVFSEVYRTGVPNKGFPWKVIRKDGVPAFAEASVSLLRNDKGEIIGFRGVGRDITERRRAEQALLDEAARQRILMEQSRDGIVILNQDGHVYDCNQKFADMVGYPFESMHQLTVFDWEYLYRPERTLEMIRSVDEKGDHFETKHRRKDGSTYDVEISTNAAVFARQKLVFCICRDITERKEVEDKLRQSKENYRALFDSAVISALVVDAETMQVMMANQAALKMFGFSSPEEGVNPLDFVPLEDREKNLERIVKDLFEKDLRKSIDLPAVTKDGRKIWVSATGARITHGGRLAGLLSFTEITERKQAEEALRRSEERYRTILEEMEEGYYEQDLAGNFTFVNKAMGCHLGYSLDELTGMNYRVYTPEDDVKRRYAMWNKLYQTGETVKELPLVNICKDGTPVFVEDSVLPLRNEKGETIGFRGVERNITERKQAEETLRRSEERYRTILEEMEDAYSEVDLGGHLTFVNNSVCRHLGYSREELIGMSFKGFTIEEDIESVFRVFNEVYRTGVPNKGFPWKTIRKDGSHGCAETSVSLLRNDKGEIIGFRSVGRDITKRKQAEEALRQSEENYRALFDSAVIGTVVLDAETLKIVMVNQAAVKMFGFSSSEEALEVDPFGFILPDDRERYLEIAKKALFEQNSHEAYEIRAMTKDGREKWINATATTIMHKGKLAALISFADITEQKKQNERLMMTDRLASLGELASGTAHELNNPLTSIIGFSQLLMEREVPDDIRQDLKLIHNEAQRAASVTKNLLTFARKHAPVKQLTQINNAIEDVLKLRTYEHKVNGIEVERQLDADLPEIMVDYFQMQQVFMNIIINAEYFLSKAHNKGTLTITTKKQNNTVRISFADDGPGIPPENLKRIFDPFFTTKEAGKGTGLGLSICHGIVTEHGGQIYARSQPGKGATIFVELPINGRDHIGGTL